MMKKLICLLVLFTIPTIAFSEEVIRERKVYPNKTAELIYYSEGMEIGRQKYDKVGNLTETTGTIPDGLVKEYYPSGQLMWELTYKNGREEGIAKGYYESNNLMSEGCLKNGEREGIWKNYYENGNLMSESSHKNGKFDGILKSYYENGKLKWEGSCNNNKIEGISKSYYENGVILFITAYKNSKVVYLKEFDENGNLINEYSYD